MAYTDGLIEGNDMRRLRQVPLVTMMMMVTQSTPPRAPSDKSHIIVDVETVNGSPREV